MIWTAASWWGLAPFTRRVGLCQTKIDAKVGRVIASWEKSNRAVYYKPARETPEDIMPTLDALGNWSRAKPSHAAFPQHPGPLTPGLFPGWAPSFMPGTSEEGSLIDLLFVSKLLSLGSLRQDGHQAFQCMPTNPAILPRLILENAEMGYMDKVRLAPRMPRKSQALQPVGSTLLPREVSGINKLWRTARHFFK